MHVKKGDLVEMISGKQKGQRGKVLRVDPKRGMVKVEGMRVVTKHVRPTAESKGQIDKREAFFPACKVMPVDPATDRPTRVNIRIVDGKKIRVGKSGTPLPVAER